MCPALAACLLATALGGDASILRSTELPTWPQATSRAGFVAGHWNGRLVVAGGTDGSRHHDDVHVLDLAEGTWTVADGTLPRPTADAVSLTVPELGILIAGGTDGSNHHDEVFLLRVEGDVLDVEPLPNLPVPTAAAAGALLGRTLCIVGGHDAPAATIASDRLWTLDLSDPDAGWIERTALPGGGRILPTTGVHADRLLVFGGQTVEGGRRADRTDAWAWSSTDDAWTGLAELPSSAVGAASPAIPVGHDALVLLGGGLDTLLVYAPITDTWRTADPPRTLDADDSEAADANRRTVAVSPTVPLPDGVVTAGPNAERLLMIRPVLPSGQLASMDWIVIAFYLLALVAMGFYFAGREHGTDDFFLAGGRIPWWAAGISIFATGLSAITFMAIPAKAYETDWVYFFTLNGAVVLAPVVAYVFLPFYRRLGLTTAYEYLERRFGPSVRLLGSGQFILAQLGRVSVVVFLPALALSAVTGIDVIVCITLMGLLAIVYTVLGGIEVVIWSDVLQAVVLMGGALLAVWIMLSDIPGGLGGAIEAAAAHDKLRLINPGFDLTQPVLLVVILGTLFNNIIPYTSDQAVIQRYLTTPDERSARFAIWTGGLLAIPSSILFFGLGTLLWVWYRTHPESLAPLGAVDQILPWFIVTQLPTGVSGLVIAAIFAAAMSSIDSSMNSVSTAWTTDFHRRFRPNLDDRAALRVARWTTVLFGIVGTAAAILIATLDIRSVLDLWFKVLGLFASGLCGLFILGIFTRRPGTVAAIAGLATSAAVNFVVGTWTNVNVLLIAGFGIVSCVAAGMLVGWFLPGRGEHEGLTIASPPPAAGP
ncbi:MAG: hypothetical protein CMJ41_05075 [Phycisphaerae bacterium]|nr:hypothetical protein [Phycisphaerae bacterium]